MHADCKTHVRPHLHCCCGRAWASQLAAPRPEAGRAKDDAPQGPAILLTCTRDPSLHGARTNFWISESSASTSSMEQREDTIKIARRHGRREETKPGSGGSLAASVEASGDTSAKLRKLLDSTDPPFKVETSALSRKSRRKGEKLQDNVVYSKKG